MLELLLNKVTGLTQDVAEIKQDVTLLKQDVTSLKQDVKLIKTQQSENGEILQSVHHAQESQKAQHGVLQMEVANLSGEMRRYPSSLFNLLILSNLHRNRQLQLPKSGFSVLP